MKYKRKYKRLNSAFPRYKCCNKRLMVGLRKYCSIKCYKTINQLKSKIDYRIDYKYKIRLNKLVKKQRKKQEEWMKLSDDEKCLLMMEYSMEYLKILSEIDKKFDNGEK